MAYKALDAITVSDIEALGIEQPVAAQLHERLSEVVRVYGSASPATWNSIIRRVLKPDLPFSLHQMLYYGCYKDFGPDPPAWKPDPENAVLTNVGGLLMEKRQKLLGSKYRNPMSSFTDFQEFSVSNPEVYWKTVLEEMDVSFSTPPKCIFRESTSGESLSSNPGGQWLPGAFLNPAKNCLCFILRCFSDFFFCLF